MRLAALLATLAAGPAMAEAAFLGPMLDVLGNPESSAEELVEALKSAGLDVQSLQTLGPEALPPNVADPFYFDLRAVVSSGLALATGDRPDMVVYCSRIGHATRDALETGTLISAVQLFSPAQDFPPGAVAQLKCRVDLLQLKNTVLPTVDEVLATVEPRFTETGIETGTAANPNMGAGWVLYPPLEPVQPGVSEVIFGRTMIEGRNPAMPAPGKPDWITYRHSQTDFAHSFDLVSHIPLSGS